MSDPLARPVDSSTHTQPTPEAVTGGPALPPKRMPSLGWFLVSIAMGLLAGWAVWRMEGTTREAVFMSGIFALAASLWVTEALPLFATSLLVIGLQAMLLANPGRWPGFGFEAGASPSYRQILANAADPVLVLFFGGFVLAHAAVKEGVDRALSARLLRPFGTRPHWVLLGLMLVTLMFGMWMSNTATAAMMLALVMPIVTSLHPRDPFRKALVLGVAVTANIGGMGTPIASPPNAVAMGFLGESGHTIPFLNWMLVGVPLTLGLTLLAWGVLCKAFPPKTAAVQLEQPASRLSVRGWFVMTVFGVTVLLWMSDQWHGLPAAVVALLPAVVLTTTGVFTGSDLARLEWRILILIAGGVSLGTGMQLTGLDQLVVRWLPGSDANAFWLLTALVLATLAIGTFMSNTAAANLLLPIGLSTAALPGASQLPATQVGMSIALVASLSMALPISTPPNALAFSYGEFSTREMAQVTLVISAVGALTIILLGGAVMRFWGVIP